MYKEPKLLMFRKIKGNKFLPYQKLFKSKSLSTIHEDLDISFTMTNLNESNFNLTANNAVGPSTSTAGASATNPNIQNPVMNIFNSLRIPDAIKDLPKFDGNHRLLYEFINNVEEILMHLRGVDSTPYANILLRAIRNKIEGQANEVLNMYGTPLNWDDIKNNLIIHYSDKRTETSLIKDLHNIRQTSQSVESFYSQIVEIQSTLNNNILIHENNDGAITAKKELFAEMCLNAFLTGLREPLGSTIRAMRPDSLVTALTFCIKENNITYQKSNSNILPQFGFPYFKNSDITGQSFSRRFSNFSSPHYTPNSYNHNSYSQTRPTLNQPNTNINNYQRNYNQGRYNAYSPNFKTNNFPNRNFHQNRNDRYNPFNRDNSQHNKPEPMDTTSAQSRQTNKPEKMDTSSGNTNFRNSARTQNSKFSQNKRRELNNINTVVNDQDELPINHQEELCNIEDGNFRIPAWLNQQGT